MARIILTALAALALASPAVHAIPIKYEGLGYHKVVTYTYDGNQSKAKAGQIKVLLDGGPEPLLAYCVDLEHTVKNNWDAAMEPVSILGATGGLVAFLYESFGPTISSGIDAAALQVAIWETRYDSDGNLDSGMFFLSGSINQSIYDKANDYLATVPTSHDPFATTRIIASGVSPHSQDLIVPEPATLLFLSLAAGPFLTRRR